MAESPVRGTNSILLYADLEAAQEYIVRVFGLSGGLLEHDEAGEAMHGEVFAGDQVIWLHRTGEGLRSPNGSGGPTSMTIVLVDDVDEHHEWAVSAGADIIEEPIDQPYGAREFGARDPEGHLWYFHSPLLVP